MSKKKKTAAKSWPLWKKGLALLAGLLAIFGSSYWIVIKADLIKHRISQSTASDLALTFTSFRNLYDTFYRSYPTWVKFDEVENKTLHHYIVQYSVPQKITQANAPIAVAAMKRLGDARFSRDADNDQAIAMLDSTRRFLKWRVAMGDQGASGDLAIYFLLEPRGGDLKRAVDAASQGKDPFSQALAQKLSESRGYKLWSGFLLLESACTTIVSNSMLITGEVLAKIQQARSARFD